MNHKKRPMEMMIMSNPGKRDNKTAEDKTINGLLTSRAFFEKPKIFYKRISFWLIVISIIIIGSSFLCENNEFTENQANEIISQNEIEEFKLSCDVVSYDDLARNPSVHKGNNYVFNGKIQQVIEVDGQSQYLINVKYDGFSWENPIFVVINSEYMDGRFLEDDVVTFYGISSGLYTYETVLGSQKTIPSMYAYCIEK